jgi:hypothetical protein
MLIEVTAENTQAKKRYLRKLLRAFIESRMKTYREPEAQSAARDAAKTKYLASLWMVASVTGALQPEEIAQESGIACGLLRDWESDEEFNALVAGNYKEFLIYIVNLFA